MDIASLLLDLQPKVTNFHRVRSIVISNDLTKIASKSVHPFSWQFTDRHKQTDRLTHTHTGNRVHTNTHRDRQINCSGNITPPRFRGGVKTEMKKNVKMKNCEKSKVEVKLKNFDMNT